MELPVRSRAIPKEAIDLIKKYEGFRSAPYLCPAKIPTIGYGTTRYPNGVEVTLKDPNINPQQAEEYLLSHLKTYALQLPWLLVPVNLTDNQFSALLSFVYNLGYGAFSRSSLRDMIKSNPLNPKITAEFKKWDKTTIEGTKVSIPGLAKRRKEEAELYFKS
jgi:lysozyme